METRPSLLLRIRDTSDRDAWNEFSSIYRPAIVRIAKIRGLQNADAEDLAQQVLLSVSSAIENWSPDSDRARFRTWLNRITINAVSNAVTRRKPDQGSGRDTVMDLLNQNPENQNSENQFSTLDELDSSDLEIELRREVFRYAANRIEGDFHPETWQAFWLTAVQGLAIEEVANKLGKNRGSIYAARSRVMRQLKITIHELQIIDEDQNDD